MYDNGFVKLYRKLRTWGWYSDSAVKSVFLHLLIIANWEESTFLHHVLHPGDCVVSYKRLSEELGLSTQQVRTAVKKLESTGEISKKSTNKYSIITVENWALYQGEAPVSNNPATNEQQSSNNPATNEQQHIKNIKNIKNNKNARSNTTNTTTRVRNVIPPDPDAVKAYSEKRISEGKPPVDVEYFLDYYESKNWMVGKNRMIDWQAAYRNWERREKEKILGVRKPTAPNPPINLDAIEVLRLEKEKERAWYGGTAEEGWWKR